MHNFQLIESFFEGKIEDPDLIIPTFEEIRNNTALELLYRTGLSSIFQPGNLMYEYIPFNIVYITFKVYN